MLGSFPNNVPETSSRNSKKNFDKEKDRQLAGQTSLTLFMNIKEGFGKNNRWYRMEDRQTGGHDG